MCMDSSTAALSSSLEAESSVPDSDTGAETFVDATFTGAAFVVIFFAGCSGSSSLSESEDASLEEELVAGALPLTAGFLVICGSLASLSEPLSSLPEPLSMAKPRQRSEEHTSELQ